MIPTIIDPLRTGMSLWQQQHQSSPIAYRPARTLWLIVVLPFRSADHCSPWYKMDCKSLVNNRQRQPLSPSRSCAASLTKWASRCSRAAG